MVLAILLAAAVTLDTGSVRFLLLGAIVAPCVALIAVSPFGRLLRRAHQSGRDSRLLGPWAALAAGRRGLRVRAARRRIRGCARRPRDDPRAHCAGDRRCRDPSVRADRRRDRARAGHDSGAARTHLRVRLEREARARWTPVAIVPLLTPIIWLGSPWTGASLNPARSEGPALTFGDVSDLWIYLASPCAAALVVGLLWRRFLIPPCNAWRAAGTNP
jgi:hypothetical protein